MELWQFLVGVGGLLSPFILAAFARDRAIISMITRSSEDCRNSIKLATDPIHERIGRVRDEYVREDHLNSHLERIDKRFDDSSNELRRLSDKMDKGFDDMRVLLQAHLKNGSQP